MDKVTFKDNSYSNWKDYIDQKFADRTVFNIEQFNKDNEDLLSYRVTSTDLIIKTEIIIELLYERDLLEVYDIHFNHPDSPKLMEEHKANEYGWDGQGSDFNFENLKNADDWIDVPLKYGWTETTFYFDDKEVKTEAEWKGKINSSYPIKQNYLDPYGCLVFPVVPIVIWYKHWYWKRNPDRMRKAIKIIPPMLKE